MRTRMHEEEFLTDPDLVRRLLEDQFPQWAVLPIALVDSYGTDHDIYRVGDHLSVRLPRIAWATAQVEKEALWLPRLAAHLPLAVPVQLAKGSPTADYPFEWSVCEWLPGANANGTITDLERAAVDMAAFIRALRGIDTAGAPARGPGSRGAPLVELDGFVRTSTAKLADRIDSDAALCAWDEALSAPAWTGPDVWLHGDLLPGNLLVVDGRLSAVIDFGCLNVGDPACDLQPAWTVFEGRAARVSGMSSRSTTRPGGVAAAGSSATVSARSLTTGTRTLAWSDRPRTRWPTLHSGLCGVSGPHVSDR